MLASENSIVQEPNKNVKLNSKPDGITVTEKGLEIKRLFTKPGDQFATVEWEKRTAEIKDPTGKVVFKQEDVEFPKSWSQTSTNVVVNKYFRGTLGSPTRERSVKQLISRVANTITDFGTRLGYFSSETDAITFNDELTHLLLTQKAAFNSPVWFNVGVEAHPQCSACFINSVEDTMGSILDLAKTEGMLFKYGSGAGSNLSTLRSSHEKLTGGGDASGPVSFMRGFDAFAGVIKSGGKTRRAAKMVILNSDHPDILEFVNCKADEEKKAWALIEAGYDAGFNIKGGAYDSVAFQNANHSVRVTDTFMEAVTSNAEWKTRAVTDKNAQVPSYKARDLWKAISEAAWVCGDPGLQFDSTINDWHTLPNTAPIRASNPCSEYMSIDDSACNLASLNLMKFRRTDGEFEVDAFRHAVSTLILAQEILVDASSYPTERIGQNAKAFRQLGLGYANLGALLMARGLAYDSDEARSYAASITAVMCGHAYLASALIAKTRGAFEGYAKNEVPMLRVISKHLSAAEALSTTQVPTDLRTAAVDAWRDALNLGKVHGYRNSQVTVLAPTGTIAFLMDCDTTGIEPDIALIKYKKLVGGGQIKIINNTVPEALMRLGYDELERKQILDHIEKTDTIENCSVLEAEHLSIFDCAFKPMNGKRAIAPTGHIDMMAAVQPFLSGAISKTVNMPTEATLEDIQTMYMRAWKKGLKAIAIYRDGCKRSQPLSTSEKEKQAIKAGPARRHMPDERQAITHKFQIAGHEGYLTVGLFEDGTPGEIFVVMAKEGSTISGLVDQWAQSISLLLQHGVSLEKIIEKFSHSRYEPSGWTGNPNVGMAKSITDYIVRWMGFKFSKNKPVVQEASTSIPSNAKSTFQNQSDSPACATCGSIMVRNAACYRCQDCGATSGCS